MRSAQVKRPHLSCTQCSSWTTARSALGHGGHPAWAGRQMWSVLGCCATSTQEAGKHRNPRSDTQLFLSTLNCRSLASPEPAVAVRRCRGASARSLSRTPDGQEEMQRVWLSPHEGWVLRMRRACFEQQHVMQTMARRRHHAHAPVAAAAHLPGRLEAVMMVHARHTAEQRAHHDVLPRHSPPPVRLPAGRGVC